MIIATKLLLTFRQRKPPCANDPL